MPATRPQAPHPGKRQANRQGGTDIAQHNEKYSAAFHIAIIVVLTFGLYAPSFSNGYIWDDADYVYANRLVQGTSTIFDIWFTHQTPQYYPVTFSSFWFEHKLWGLNPTGYHVVNCLLHIANAALLYFLMRRLASKFAFAVALIFAIHPIQVESVCWITERKNVLAVFFFLYATHFMLKYHVGVRLRDYLFSFVMFVLALLSKSITVSFVFVPFLVKWYKKQAITRWDVIGILPFCAVGLVAGLHTAWVEVHQVGAKGSEWELDILQKAVLPGMIILFYIYKVFIPFNFSFSYPRWDPDPSNLSYLIPTFVIVVLFGHLVIYRKRLGRGATATFAFFVISLFPALGILNVYPMRYSFVADHFAYLSTIPLIMFMVGTYDFAWKRICDVQSQFAESGQKVAILALALGSVVMGAVVVDHARDFRDQETLWLHVLEGNPRSLLALNSLGLISKDRGQLDEAIRLFRSGLEIDPHDPEIRNNLGIMMAQLQQLDAALEHFEVALREKPDYLETYNNIATIYAMKGEEDKAIPYYERMLKHNPRSTPALFNLGRIQRKQKRPEEAIRYFQRAIASDPTFPDAHLELGATYSDLGMTDLAVQEFSSVLSLNPADPRPHYCLGLLHQTQEHLERAINHFQNAIRLDPGFSSAHYQLGQIYRRTNQLADAYFHFTRAKESGATLDDEVEQFLKAQSDSK